MNDATRTAIADAALKVARHVHDGGFEAVIVSGGSHQLARSLLALGWGVQYPGERMPKTFVLDEEANDLLYKQTRPDPKGVFRPDKEGFRTWIDAHAPGLGELRDRPLVYVDDFALTGVKYTDLLRFFPEEHEFSRMSYAFFAVKENARYLTKDTFVGVADDEALTELHRLGQHIQGKEGMHDILGDIRHEAERLRSEALNELRDIGRSMRR